MPAWILSISSLPLSVPQQRRRNPQEGVYNVSMGELTIHPREMEEGWQRCPLLFRLGQAVPRWSCATCLVALEHPLKLGRVTALDFLHLFLAVLWALSLCLGKRAEAAGHTGQKCGASLS